MASFRAESFKISGGIWLDKRAGEAVTLFGSCGWLTTDVQAERVQLSLIQLFWLQLDAGPEQDEEFLQESIPWLMIPSPVEIVRNLVEKIRKINKESAVLINNFKNLIQITFISFTNSYHPWQQHGTRPEEIIHFQGSS